MYHHLYDKDTGERLKPDFEVKGKLIHHVLIDITTHTKKPIYVTTSYKQRDQFNFDLFIYINGKQKRKQIYAKEANSAICSYAAIKAIAYDIEWENTCE